MMGIATDGCPSGGPQSTSRANQLPKELAAKRTSGAASAPPQAPDVRRHRVDDEIVGSHQHRGKSDLDVRVDLNLVWRGRG